MLPPNPHASTLQTLQIQYETVDKKLLQRETELDFLFRALDDLKQQRYDLASKPTEGPFSNSIGSPNPPTDSSNQPCALVSSYYKLWKQTRAITEAIEDIKEECATLRYECASLRSKVRRAETRAEGGFAWLKLVSSSGGLLDGYPQSGFLDPKALAERILAADHTTTQVASVVGVLGTGITYNTIFSASRGRLDLMSWSLACFLLVVINVAALQLFSPPRHDQIARILHMEYGGSAEARILKFVILVGIPMIAGFVLLALSVVTINEGDAVITGSQQAILVAGWMPIAALAYFALMAVGAATYAFWLRLTSKQLDGRDLDPDVINKLTSLISSVKEKLYFLPGGGGYQLYRKQRIDRSRGTTTTAAKKSEPCDVEKGDKRDGRRLMGKKTVLT